MTAGVLTRACWFALTAWLSTLIGGCADDEPTLVRPDGGQAGTSGGIVWPSVGCDPLVPSYCGFPFPSNVQSVSDPSSTTGRRLGFLPEMMPLSDTGTPSLPDPLNLADGFSPSTLLLAHFPGATGSGLPGPNQIALSVELESPTVVLDTETGERVPHFAELDLSQTNPDQRTFMIRPVVRLEDARRYIVAIRGLEGESGPIEPSEAFRALRDGTSFDDPSIEARRPLYADIFERLGAAGVERESLLLAWDFTTRSQADVTGWLLHMRDEAFSIVGPDGPTYTIDSVEPDPDEHIAFRIIGRMQVPLYLDQPDPGAELVFGPDGLPEPNPDRPSYDVGFELLIPDRAKTEPAKLLQYGHGLLGGKGQLGAGHFRKFCQTYGYAIFGADLVGMAHDGDNLHIVDVIASGQMHRLDTMFDRMHQGALNYLLLMRMMSRRFAQDPTYGKYLNPTQRYYHGISQGGIFGGVYMSASPDVERGVLGVMGQPYSLLLNRSVDFGPFFAILGMVYPDARDQQLLLNLVQILWDRVEPGGWTKYLSGGLPGTPKHSVLMRAAVGDHQVSTLGAHLMARTIGATHLDTGIREIWGLPRSAGPVQGSAYVEYDFGLPPEPECNVPTTWCKDPHGNVRDLEAAEKQMDLFLRTGRAENFCAGGVCSFPELSGCVPGATYQDPCVK
jgi:hypothetical protein